MWHLPMEERIISDMSQKKGRIKIKKINIKEKDTFLSAKEEQHFLELRK